jgi:peptidoglycan/xylan/chitin deacetylase (PgdA/CDA1 family)
MKNKIKKYIMICLPARFLRYKERDSTIYLTFDDGPDRGVTPKVLEILKKYNIKASFFIIGEKAAQLPDIVKNIHVSNHTVANHSYYHKRFANLELFQQLEEIDLTNKTINSIIDTRCNIFRPPGGIWSFKLLWALIKKGMLLVNWNRDSLDCRDKTAQEIINIFKEQPIQGGDIILFHDDNEKVCDILQEMLPYWKKQGFNFSALTS